MPLPAASARLALTLTCALATFSAPATARDFDTTLYRNGETLLKPTLEFQTAYFAQTGAWGGYAEAGYTFVMTPWEPHLSYRFSIFTGDDASKHENESFDPLNYGFDEWGTTGSRIRPRSRCRPSRRMRGTSSTGTSATRSTSRWTGRPTITSPSTLSCLRPSCAPACTPGPTTALGASPTCCLR